MFYLTLLSKVGDNLNNTKRESNIELLRIIAMVLLVAHHYAYHGLLAYNSDIVFIIFKSGEC